MNLSISTKCEMLVWMNMLSKKVTCGSNFPNDSFEGILENWICYKRLFMLVLSIENKIQISYMLNLLKGDYELRHETISFTTKHVWRNTIPYTCPWQYLTSLNIAHVCKQMTLSTFENDWLNKI
jgi:hypothetical protein